jgi:hypothetical protein
MSWLSRAAGAVTGAVSSAAGSVTHAAAQLDPMSSRSIVGGTGLYRVARPVVATGAAGVTGGLSVLAGQARMIPRSSFGVQPTVQGYMTGAAIGTAIAGGKLMQSLPGMIGSYVNKDGAKDDPGTGQGHPQTVSEAGMFNFKSPIMLIILFGGALLAYILFGRKK